MARKPLQLEASAKQVKSASYPIWLPKDQLEVIKEAQARSGMLWPKWIERALSNFKREPAEEIASLLTTWNRDRSEKSKINVRIYESTLQEIEELCQQYSGFKQACLQHALFIYALRTIS